MKVGESCLSCIRGLTKKTLSLIGVDDRLAGDLDKIIEENWERKATPPSIANMVLRAIKMSFKVEDPYEHIKYMELERAKEVLEKLNDISPKNLLETLKLSAMGNSSDFFLEGDFDYRNMTFFADTEKIETGLSRSERVLIIGDNVSDFVFDLGLIRYLEKNKKTIYYVVRESPVQNDLSLADVKKYGLDSLFKNFVSTGTDEVGLKREDIKGLLKELWEGETFVIAKGMGNYETISEFAERPVVYVMKVKCKEVSSSVGYPVGTYIALYREGQI